MHAEYIPIGVHTVSIIALHSSGSTLNIMVHVLSVWLAEDE